MMNRRSNGFLIRVPQFVFRGLTASAGVMLR